MLEHLKLDADVESAVEKDTLGGGGPLASDVYTLTIKSAFFGQSTGKAQNITLQLETDTGRRLTVVEYITSGEAKGCKPYYEKDGKKFPLPGFAKMNSLTTLVLGQSLDQLTVEKKFLKLYDRDAQKEIPQEKPVIVDLTGKQVKAGVLQVIEDKKQNVAPQGSKPDYQPTGETREINEVVKFFSLEDKTMEESVEGKEAAFMQTWLKANQGKTKDKSTKVKAQAGAPSAGAPTLGGAQAAGVPPLAFD